MAANGAQVELSYTYPTSHATVSSGQTTVVDLRMHPQLVLGNFPIDWAAQLGQLSCCSFFSSLFAASADALPGDSVVPEATWSANGIATDFRLPLDPALNWHFEGAVLQLILADGTAQLITAVPGVSSIDQTAPVPHVGAGHSVTYDFSELLRFGVGHVQFAPSGISYGFLQGKVTEVMASGVRETLVQKASSAPGEAPTATVIDGQQTLTATWFDSSFNLFTAELSVYVAPKETVVLTDNPPALDLFQPLSDITTCSERIDVTGIVGDADSVAALTVNGRKINFNKKSGSFSTKIDVPKGDSCVVVAATDDLGHSITRTRPLHRPPKC